MTTPHQNGTGPGVDPPLQPTRNEEQEIAARQQAAETYIRQVVDARMQELISRQGNTPVVQPPTSPGNSAGTVVAAIISKVPEICTAIVSALNAFTQVKVASNPLGHLEIIAQTNPRLLALYAPNPLGDQFQNIFGNAYLLGMRAAQQARAIATTPLVPGAPALPAGTPPTSPPGSTPSTSAKPSANTPGSAGSVGMQNFGTEGMDSFTDDQFLSLLGTLQEEYQRRYVGVR